MMRDKFLNTIRRLLPLTYFVFILCVAPLAAGQDAAGGVFDDVRIHPDAKLVEYELHENGQIDAIYHFKGERSEFMDYMGWWYMRSDMEMEMRKLGWVLMGGGGSSGGGSWSEHGDYWKVSKVENIESVLDQPLLHIRAESTAEEENLIIVKVSRYVPEVINVRVTLWKYFYESEEKEIQEFLIREMYDIKVDWKKATSVIAFCNDNSEISSYYTEIDVLPSPPPHTHSLIYFRDPPQDPGHWLETELELSSEDVIWKKDGHIVWITYKDELPPKHTEKIALGGISILSAAVLIRFILSR